MFEAQIYDFLSFLDSSDKRSGNTDPEIYQFVFLKTLDIYQFE